MGFTFKFVHPDYVNVFLSSVVFAENLPERLLLLSTISLISSTMSFLRIFLRCSIVFPIVKSTCDVLAKCSNMASVGLRFPSLKFWHLLFIFSGTWNSSASCSHPGVTWSSLLPGQFGLSKWRHTASITDALPLTILSFTSEPRIANHREISKHSENKKFYHHLSLNC